MSYAIDSSKFSLFWDGSRRSIFETGLAYTVEWYLNETWLTRVITGEYETYYQKQYSKGSSG
jgi:dTDP-glucose 4,6-dehydratase